MTDQASLFDRIFSSTIAFLLPGLAVMVGTATISPVVRAWFGGASTSPSIVGFLFVLFAALALGFIITAVRWFVFERMTWWPRTAPLVPRGQPINEAKRQELFAAYEDLRFQHYYHYLASANMAVAVPIAIAIWLVGSEPTPPAALALGVAVGGGLLVIVLGAAAREALARYNDRRLRLVGPHPDASVMVVDGDAARAAAAASAC